MFGTCRWVDAHEALSLGLVTRVFVDETFHADVHAYAEQIALAAPLSVRFVKRLVYHRQDTDLDTHLGMLRRWSRSYGQRRSQADCGRSGEKRPPVFRGR